MSRKQNLYMDRSGQRGYNVAIPEIDVGEDILVVRDADGDLSPIQVKSAIGKGQKRVSGQFNVPEPQLRKPHLPELHYVFALHHAGLWREFVIIRRDVLENLHDKDGIGSLVSRKLVLYLSFGEQDVICSETDLQAYRGDWSQWPLIQH